MTITFWQIPIPNFIIPLPLDNPNIVFADICAENILLGLMMIVASICDIGEMTQDVFLQIMLV